MASAMRSKMKRVIGLGGIFFKARDPKALYEWYRKHLGIESAADGSGAMWRDADHPEIPGCNLLAIFPQTTKYLGGDERSFMLNFRVDDLNALVKALREEGVQVDDKVEEHEYGKFGWITDPEGNRVELWEPPKTEVGG
jgi:catechol 2,3-dioxygenase-like lactoylglutathione lyase family enzyme